MMAAQDSAEDPPNTMAQNVKDLLDQGTVQANHGMYEHASMCFEGALQLSKQRGDITAQTHAHNGLARAFYIMGRESEGLEHLNAATALCSQAGDTSQDTALTALGDSMLLNMGSTGIDAAKQHQQLVAAADAEPDVEAAATMRNAALALSLASGTYEQGLQHAGSIANPQSLHVSTVCVHNTGTGLLQLQQAHRLTGTGADAQRLDLLKGARVHLEAAVAALAEQQAALHPVDQHAQWVSIFDAQQGVYQALQDCLMQLGEPEEALAVAERGRARAMVKDLHRKGQPLPAAISGQPSARALMQELRDALEATGAALAVEFTLIQNPLLLVWAVRPSGVAAAKCINMSELGLTHGQLRELLRSLQTNMAAIGSWAGHARRGAEPDGGCGLAVDGAAIAEAGRAAVAEADLQLETLACLLLDPLADTLAALPADSTVLFVLDGALHSVPFAALRPPPGMEGSNKQPFKFLLQHINMAVAPSITVAGLCGRRWKELAETFSEGASCIVGDPNNNLKGSRAEAELVAADYGGRRNALLGNRATLAAVMQRMRPAFLVHLATHAVQDPEHFPMGAIMLADEPLTPELLVDQLQGDNKLSARLTVVSACSSGGGQIRGEGIMGLGRALLLAGCPCCVLALWDLSDLATPALMPAFYERLQAGDTVAAALRAAQLQQLNTSGSCGVDGPPQSHPALWAAFQAVGAACVTLAAPEKDEDIASTSDTAQPGSAMRFSVTKASGVFRRLKLRKDETLQSSEIGFCNVRGEDVHVCVASTFANPQSRSWNAGAGATIVPAGGNLNAAFATDLYPTKDPSTKFKVPGNGALYRCPVGANNTGGKPLATVALHRPQSQKPWRVLVQSCSIRPGHVLTIESHDDLMQDLSNDEWHKL